MQIKTNLVLAFTNHPQGGNPAGVVLNDRSLSDQQMQLIASKVGYSETAFVQKVGAEFKIEFYTPNRRIANCGHATVATFAYLKSVGLISDGKLTVNNDLGRSEVIVKENTAALAHVSYAQSPVPDVGAALQSVGLADDDLSSPQSLFIGSTGGRFLMARLKDEETLAKVIPNLAALTNLSESLELTGAYLFCLKSLSQRPEVVATTRMFAPYYGISEESATGMAAAPLAFYLRQQKLTARDHFVLFQGDLMPTPRHAELNCEFTASGQVVVGGEAVVLESRLVEISD